MGENMTPLPDLLKDAREWFLRNGGSGFQPLGIVVKGPEFEGHVHVIEAAPVLAVIEKLTEMREKDQQFMRDCNTQWADKCDKLQQENEILLSKQSQYESTMLATIEARDKLQQKCERYEKVLEFYADKKTWLCNFKYGGHETPLNHFLKDDWGIIVVDSGKTAQEALKGEM